MTQRHQRLVQDMLTEYKKDPTVIAINLMGSVARNEARPGSDIDIEIVTNEKERKCDWQIKKRESIKIDFVRSSKGQMIYQINHYPFFNLHQDKQIMYDPTGFMVKIKRMEQEYLDKHPEVTYFWQEKVKYMKEKKAKGEKKESLRDIWDEAERLFSEQHTVTRDWFRK